MHRVQALGVMGVTCMLAMGAAVGCARPGEPPVDERPRPTRSATVRPGITVLLDDSIHLVRGKRVGLLTNHTGIDARGESDIDLLTRDPRAVAAGVRLVTLFAPEHGIRGTEDRENVASEVDQRTGLPIHSMYGSGTLAPADSLLDGLDVLVFDLQDIGTRTWTYVGLMVYAIRSAARNKLPIVVLDRPNPISGARAEGTLLDTAIANPNDPSPSRPGQAYALYPFPLRHGMTMGELARFYNETLGLGAQLHVVPMTGWRRELWFDETGLPWVKPSPNMPSLASALVYPATVPFEGSNLSVGRGTPDAFQHIGAPWLRADSAVKLLNDLGLVGVRFAAERFTPRAPTDRKFAEQSIPGIHVVVTDRERAQMARVGAALLWAVHRVNPDSLRLRDATVDLRLGAARVREALMRGEDPDAVIDRELPSVVRFERNARKFLIYR